MCGLWGFVGDRQATLSFRRQRLFDVADRASTRGPYAVGVAYLENGKVVSENRRGLPSENLPLVAKVPVHARVVIGCCRLGTFGSHLESYNNQPLYNNDCAVVHNGNFYNFKDLAKEHNVRLETETDTEILLKLLPILGAEETVEALSAPQVWNAFVFVVKGKVFAYRQGHPLYLFRAPEGTYFCSRKPYPQAELMQDHVLVQLN